MDCQQSDLLSNYAPTKLSLTQYNTTTMTFFLSKTIIILFICFSSIIVKGQEVDIYNEEIEISQNDIKEALEFIGLRIFNFKMNIPKDGKYKLIFYIDEFVENKLVAKKDLVVVRSPHKAFKNKELIQKDLEKIRIIINKSTADTSTFSFETQIRGPRSARKFKTKVNTKFERNFDIRPFKLEKPKIGKDNPLILVGSYWQYLRNGEIDYRFCSSNELDADFTDEAFEEMPSHYILGYKLIKLED